MPALSITDTALTELVYKLKRYLLKTLSCPGTVVKEYELLQGMDREELFNDLGQCNEPLLQLFRKHFLLMHSLYALRPELLERGQALHIDPLGIELIPCQTVNRPEQSVRHGREANLAAFYGDFSNLRDANADNVANLLADFYQQVQAWQEGADARNTLQVGSDASWEEIQVRYRQLANTTHPDKGGSGEEFQRVADAYFTLKTIHGKR